MVYIAYMPVIVALIPFINSVTLTEITDNAIFLTIFADMKALRLIIIAAAAVCALASCKHDNLSPYGWKRINPQIDSLTLKLERQWLYHADDETIALLIDSLRTFAKRFPSNTALSVRADYWAGRLATRQGDYEQAEAYFNRAFAMNDSLRNPYETHRLMWQTEPDPLPANNDTYDYLVDQINFFESAGDMVLAGATSMTMGMFLNDLGNSQRAGRWLDKADSLFTLAGMDSIVSSNRMNRVNVLAMSGDSASAVIQLRQLLDDPEFCKDPQALDLALSSMFYIGKDTASIFDAYNRIRYQPEMEDIAALYESTLAGVFVARHQLDSAETYARLAMDKIDMIYNRRMRIDILAWAAETAQANGQLHLANDLLIQRLEETETLIEETRRDEVLSHELSKHIISTEYNADRRLLKSRLITWLTIALSLIALILVWAFYNRRLHRHRLKTMEQQLKYEKSNRRLVATQLALAQKQSLLGDIERSIATTDDETGHIVDSAIRSHRATAEMGEGTFLETYAEINPQFIPNLLATYPGLTPNDCRLLTLIAIGMPNKQIAVTLGIRPESVKQSRRRLRAKMHIAPSASIESAIAPLL